MSEPFWEAAATTTSRPLSPPPLSPPLSPPPPPPPPAVRPFFFAFEEARPTASGRHPSACAAGKAAADGDGGPVRQPLRRRSCSFSSFLLSPPL